MILVSNVIPSEDTYIDSRRPDKNFGNIIVSWVGTKNSLTVFRYLARFDFDCIPEDAEIVSCSLKLYVDCVRDKTVGGLFTPYMIASDWAFKTVTWYTQPQIYESIHSQAVAIGDIGWYQWDITDLFNKWYTGAFRNYGVLLKDDGFYNNDSKRIINSRNRKCASIYSRPRVTIKYKLPTCREDVFISGKRFTECAFAVPTGDVFQHTAGFDTSQQSNTTMFIKNLGLFPAKVYVVVSPNDTDYVADGPLYEVSPGITIALVPKHFSKYAHIAYKSKEPGKSTGLEITIQAQL